MLAKVQPHCETVLSPKWSPSGSGCFLLFAMAAVGEAAPPLSATHHQLLAQAECSDQVLRSPANGKGSRSDVDSKCTAQSAGQLQTRCDTSNAHSHADDRNIRITFLRDGRFTGAGIANFAAADVFCTPPGPLPRCKVYTIRSDTVIGRYWDCATMAMQGCRYLQRDKSGRESPATTTPLVALLLRHLKDICDDQRCTTPNLLCMRSCMCSEYKRGTSLRPTHTSGS